MLTETAKESNTSEWEWDEVDNPLRSTSWVFNSSIRQLTVSGSVEITDGEDLQWHAHMI